MRVATDHRESADERHPAPQEPPRLGGTDLFRGALVILAAVVIGGLVLSRGIDDDANVRLDGVQQDDVDPAASAGTDTTAVSSESTAAETEAETADQSAVGTDASTDPTTAVTDPADEPLSTESTTTTTTPLDTVRAPAEVRTIVLNAGGPQGIAGRATELLQAASYTTSAAKNADVNGPSAIYYAEGFQAEALAVASVFGPDLEALVQPLDLVDPPTIDLQESAVIVVVGNDDVIAVP